MTNKKWTLELDEYEVANLLWLIEVCGYPYIMGNSVEPFTLANNGDWIGQIYNKLEAQGRPEHTSNDSASHLREQVEQWKKRQ